LGKIYEKRAVKLRQGKIGRTFERGTKVNTGPKKSPARRERKLLLQATRPGLKMSKISQISCERCPGIGHETKKGEDNKSESSDVLKKKGTGERNYLLEREKDV